MISPAPKPRNLPPWMALAGLGLSAAILTVIQSPIGWGWLAWVAWVPFVWVCDSGQSTRRLVWLSFGVSAVYWLANLYWIGYVTVPAYILFCLYLALYWPILVWGFRYLHGQWGLPYFVCTPLLILGAEAWQGILITGFDWRLLAHSQYGNWALIQIADLVGVTGISFLIAMVNGLVADLLIEARQNGIRKTIRMGNGVKTVVTTGLIVATILYGRHRIAETASCLQPGPVIAAVQPNIPSNIKELADSAEPILRNLFQQSSQAYVAGAALVAWPETMVLTTLNAGFVAFCKEDSNPVFFDKQISEFVKDKGHLVVGAHAADLVFDEQNNPVILHKYNSAFLYRSNGMQEPQRYDKMHLVPFGEYIPLRDFSKRLNQWLLKLTPYDYDYQLTHGTHHTTFEIEVDKQKYRFGILICYEDTDAQVARRNTVDPSGKKKTDWLVNISNDGWYVRYLDGKVLPSTELPQRTILTAFRAIENRVWIIRSVNTGISCLIDSTGRIRDGFEHGNLPRRAMDRQAVAGWFADRVQVDSRVTFFSRHGPWLKHGFAAVFVLITALGMGQSIVNRTRKGI
ncbi:MAG: apolipoprotein N-acyltransferase [Phycisphaerae bacterium]|nr:apolipoprotein N-acyltransferase [Phycisphaerae bacterium]